MRATTERVPVSAHSGAYGARPYDRIAEGAKVLLASIEQEIGGADFFTREDLLHLSAFDYVSTATRFAYIREALGELMRRGKVLERSRTELCLAGRARSYRTPQALADEFGPRVMELARMAIARTGSVAVMDVVGTWNTDPHLTENVKRVTARNVLKAAARDGELVASTLGRFVAAEG